MSARLVSNFVGTITVADWLDNPDLRAIADEILRQLEIMPDTCTRIDVTTDTVHVHTVTWGHGVADDVHEVRTFPRSAIES